MPAKKACTAYAGRQRGAALLAVGFQNEVDATAHGLRGDTGGGGPSPLAPPTGAEGVAGTRDVAGEGPAGDEGDCAAGRAAAAAAVTFSGSKKVPV